MTCLCYFCSLFIVVVVVYCLSFVVVYSLVSTPQTVVQLSVHMASMLLDLTVGFLTRILSAGPTQEALQALSSSYLMSKLLPNILAQLGTIASQQPEVRNK